MKLLALERAVLMFLAFEAGVTTSAFEIRVHLPYMEDSRPYILLHGKKLDRFLECLCSTLTIQCSAHLDCNFKTKILCDVTSVTNKIQKVVSDLNVRYTCILIVYPEKVSCTRSFENSSKIYSSLHHIKEASVCQLNCVEIHWSHNQHLLSDHSPKDSIVPGAAPSTCKPSLTSVSTTISITTPKTTRNISTTTQTTISAAIVTTTLKTVKQQTSVRVASTNDTYTTDLQTDNMFNGGSGDADNKVPIIVGVTISLFAIIAVGVGIFLLRRRRQKRQAHSSRKSQKESQTVSCESVSNIVTKNESPSYSNMNSGNQGYVIDAMETYITANSEIMDEYTIVNYSNGVFYHTNSEQPMFHCPVPQQSDSIVYLNNQQARPSAEKSHTLINNNGDLSRETGYSNTEPLCFDASHSEMMDTYLNVAKKQNPPLGEIGSAIVSDSGPVYYELESTKNNSDSEKQTIGEIGDSTDPATGTHKVYSKFGDQTRQFNNPYNSLSGTVISVTVANLDLPAVTVQSNLSSDYCLASSII